MSGAAATADRFWGARARPVPAHVRAAVEAHDRRLFLDWNPRAKRYEFLYLRSEPDSVHPRPLPPWGFHPVTGKRHRDLAMCMAVQDPDGSPRVPTVNDVCRLRLHEFTTTWDEEEALIDREDAEQEARDGAAMSARFEEGHKTVAGFAAARFTFGWKPPGAMWT